MKTLNTIVKLKFGSHLYGISTPDSDTDIKGVFLPTKREILLGKIPNNYSESTKKGNDTRNTSEDIDTEMFSLHRFIKLACEGQTIALDMLHASDNMIYEKTDIWDSLVENRHRFYNKRLKAFIGYARNQATRYSVKGDRVNAAKKVVDILNRIDEEKRMEDIWSFLPEENHLHFIGLNPNGIPQYQICGKIFQSRSKIGYVKKILNTFIEEYGKRAHLAANNKGLDFKAISHALRVAYEVRQLLNEETITFPLREAPFLLKVKKGEVDFLTVVSPHLDSLMDEIENLVEKSNLPEKIDRKWWDEWLYNIIEKEVI